MLRRVPTNTLLLTNLPEGVLWDPTPLAKYLAAENHPIELVTLPRFGRIVVVCQRDTIAVDISKMLKLAEDWKDVRISFSIKNNEFHMLNGEDAGHLPGENRDFLELPPQENMRRFLISPPLSPDPEWDNWDMLEEDPNKKSIYSPKDLSHLLWERLGNLEGTQVRRVGLNDLDEDDCSDGVVHDVAQKPEILFEDITNGVPAIVLDGLSSTEEKTEQNNKYVKTTMPPISD